VWSMPLTFPNQCRSYDRTRNRVRFWAHDAVLEITFFVGADVLYQTNSWTQPNEAAVLDAFDRNRDRLCAAAERVYTRHGSDAYTLTANDCKGIAGI